MKALKSSPQMQSLASMRSKLWRERIERHPSDTWTLDARGTSSVVALKLVLLGFLKLKYPDSRKQTLW